MTASKRLRSCAQDFPNGKEVLRPVTGGSYKLGSAGGLEIIADPLARARSSAHPQPERENISADA